VSSENGVSFILLEMGYKPMVVPLNYSISNPKVI
jgi:hypothetical protein